MTEYNGDGIVTENGRLRLFLDVDEAVLAHLNDAQAILNAPMRSDIVQYAVRMRGWALDKIDQNGWSTQENSLFLKSDDELTPLDMNSFNGSLLRPLAKDDERVICTYPSGKDNADAIPSESSKKLYRMQLDFDAGDVDAMDSRAAIDGAMSRSEFVGRSVLMFIDLFGPLIEGKNICAVLNDDRAVSPDFEWRKNISPPQLGMG